VSKGKGKGKGTDIAGRERTSSIREITCQCHMGSHIGSSDFYPSRRWYSI